ncbi:MAG: hypothetical protein C0504_18565 [Candidatus Solibacter sp.]|nr:hypothetical protein [Candidatus Solibacter sp.]
MKHLLITLCMTFALAASEPPKPAPKPPAGIPAAAVPAGDNTWRHTDSSGKTWLYVQTPFGFNRMEEKATPGAAEQARSGDKAAAPAIRVSSVKDGVVTFERDTPFGKSKWTRKRAELSAGELAALSAFDSAAPAARK